MSATGTWEHCWLRGTRLGQGRYWTAVLPQFQWMRTGSSLVSPHMDSGDMAFPEEHFTSTRMPTRTCRGSARVYFLSTAARPLHTTASGLGAGYLGGPTHAHPLLATAGVPSRRRDYNALRYHTDADGASPRPVASGLGAWSWLPVWRSMVDCSTTTCFIAFYAD